MKIKYTLTVDSGSPDLTCDVLVSQCPVVVEGSGVRKDESFVQFRASSDEEARTIARQTEGGNQFRLHTGYGIHRREIAP